MSAPAMEEKILRDYRALATRLGRIDLPDRHKWSAREEGLRWFAGSVPESVRHGVSILAELATPNEDDPRQLHIEARIFWSRSAGEDPDPNHMRAILWVTRGRRTGLQAKSLLGEAPALFMAATSVDGLATQLLLKIDAALAAFRREEAAADRRD